MHIMKAHISSGSTVMLGGVGLFFHTANLWFTEYMPLVIGCGTLFTAAMTGWYYIRMANERKRENDIRAKELKRREND